MNLGITTRMRTQPRRESEFRCMASPGNHIRVNLGCGKDIRTGWINVDKADLRGVDVCHDLTYIPLPFPSNSCAEVLCKDVLEHLEYLPVLRDIHRILEPGGRVTIQVPHFTSKDAYADPTHRGFFTTNTFRYFITGHFRSYYFDFSFSRILQIHIHFDRRPGYFYNYFLELLVNSATAAQNFYEGSPLRIFPATNITVVLQK
jgi:SAM-dependent methyltransferase